MGLIPESEVVVEDAADSESLRALLARVQRAGIGRGLAVPRAPAGHPGASGEPYQEDTVAACLEGIIDAMEGSPVPDLEWPALERVLGPDLLAGLLQISPSSFRRYSAGERSTPDDVAARLHFLALVVGDLAGSYNEIGIRRWFARRRSQLGGRAPMELLEGSWAPEDAEPSRVRALAEALLGSTAT
jgi:hypothetical protein